MGLENDQRIWNEEIEDIERLSCEYFTNIFITTNLSPTQPNAALTNLLQRVTRKMNNFLDKKFTKEEISTALAQICPTKAAGLDELPAAFFQNHWNLVKEKMITTCLYILNEGGSLAPFNHTYIALIPKVHNLTKLTNFRLISICNIIYRILAKILAND